MLAGRYRVVREVGRGAMGAVYVVTHVNTGATLALKVMLDSVFLEQERGERFRREARAASLVQSDHVVRITDADFAPELIAFTRNQGTPASPEFDLYSALRGDGGVFGAPTPISGTNTVAQEYSPNLSDNLLSIVFERQVANGDSMLFYATRTSASGAFAEAQLLGGIAASTYTAQPFARGDLTTVTYVQADNEMEIEVYKGVATGAAGVTGSYASSVLLPATVTGPGKNAPTLSADGKYVYYSDEAGDGGTDLDMFVVAVDDPSHPHALTTLDTESDERCGWISLDSCRLYYDSDAVHPGGARWLYVASRPHP